MTKQELATRIWATANVLRKNIKASEYKDYILGFMFYKYLCDEELNHLLSMGGSFEDLKMPMKICRQRLKMIMDILLLIKICLNTGKGLV